MGLQYNGKDEWVRIATTVRNKHLLKKQLLFQLIIITLGQKVKPM